MKIKFLVFIFCTVLTQNLLAQKIVSGTVQSSDNSPLPGASIIVKGTNLGTQTDFDGKFTLEVEKGGVLVVSYIGFITENIVVSEENDYLITLQENMAKLDEVVVIGYGTQKKAILTSSVSSIKGDELSAEPVTNATQALQGKAAGVQVIASDAPGQASKVIIRGLGTVNGSNDPLYVVDGILTNNINNINTSDILTMNILKDAASLAIYGNRASNGVVILTTKRGHSGKMKISFDAFTGFKDILSKVKMANSEEFVTYSNEALLRTLRMDNDPSNDNDTSGYFLSNQPYNTDWLDAITRLGKVQNYNISLSGGSENLTAFFSAGLNTEEGILIGNDFERVTLRSNVNYKISDKVKYSHNVSAQLAKITPKSYGAFSAAYKQSPIVPVFDENGNYGASTSFNNVGNPVKDLDFQDDKQKYLKIQGSFKLDYKIIDPLTFTSRFSVETESGRFYSFQDRLGSYLASNPANTEALFDGGIENPAKTRLTVTHTNNYRFFIDNYFTFDKTFKEDHTIKVTLGMTSEESRGEFITGTRNNVPLDSHLKYNLNVGDADDTQLSGGSLGVKDRLYSYISRVNYDFQNKYLFNASYRRDGSSKFQKNYRIGNFFAVSAGWILTEEDFMEDGVFDKLKLRVSYGELGNQNVPLQKVTLATGPGGFYPFGPDQELQQGTTIASTISSNLTWETSNEFNIGAEFSLFDSRLNGEVDYYIKNNSNAILQIKLPDVFGLGAYDDHIGSVVNSGLETMLNWSDNINEKLKYNVGVNFSFNENELKKVTHPYFNEQIGGDIGNGQYTKRVAVGQPLGSFYLYDVIGIDDKGELVYDDVNNNGITDEGDRKFMGSFIPKYNIGFSFGANYNNFDFSLDTYTSLGSKIYNGKKAQRFGNENIEQSTFNNRWTSGGLSNTGAIASNDVPLSSNYYLESGDFFRINNITLGYTIPKNKLGFLENARIYATAKNPIIFKKYSGFTPELPGGTLGNAGIELNAYPTLKSFFIGINTSF